MRKQIICAYCGKPISRFTKLLFNDCCSYHCDISLEKEMKYGNSQPAPKSQYKSKNVSVGVNPEFIDKEDNDSFDYGFNSNTNPKRKDVFYPQIENPIDTSGYLENKKSVDIKSEDPYKRGESYENKRSGYYKDIDGTENHYDNGEIGFYSNRNPGYYNNLTDINDDDYDIVDYYNEDKYSENNLSNDEFIDDYESNNNSDYYNEDDNYYNEDEDYQIMHHDEDER